MELSVIIPSYNSSSTIKECIQSLKDQDFNGAYEIIVVDSSNDSSYHLIREWFPDINLIHIDKQTFPGTARNIGIKAAKSDFIACIDADCIAERSLLNLMKKRLEHYNIVGGSVENYYWKSIISIADHFMTFSEFMPFMPLKDVKFLPTCNIGYKRETIIQSGMFDDIRAGEDLILNWKLSKSEKMLFDPSIKVYHKNRTSLKSYLLHHFYLGKHSAIARNRIRMDGSFLTSSRIFVPLLPIIRLTRLISRIIRFKKRYILLLIISLPLYLMGLIVWSYGFSRGLSHEAV